MVLIIPVLAIVGLLFLLHQWRTGGLFRARQHEEQNDTLAEIFWNDPEPRRHGR